MKINLLLPIFCLPLAVSAQVFMQPFENAAFMAAGGANAARQTTDNGLSNPAQLGHASATAVFAWSAIPYSLKGWQSHGAQALFRAQRYGGAAVEVLHSGVEGYAEQRFSIGYGRRLSEKLSLGGSLVAMRVAAGEYGSATAFTFALGVTARPLPQLSIGAVIHNPIPQQLAAYPLSSVLRVGAQWRPSSLFSVSADMDKDLNAPAQLRVGAEYRPISWLFLRAGTRTGPARAAFGAGFVLPGHIRIDTGAEWHSILGLTPALMVSWGTED